ncbi:MULTISPECIES: hypothetical protein [unclassified Frankia]|uniref:hypothetical protein n=1 Tax=unclassified Frankia TaxID=2632575 RepID=UPI002AD21045|nr:MULTISPECIES: hypothetical protein [unclassified Frankia]
MTFVSVGFRLVGEVSADERSRIAFGRVGVEKGARYAVAVNDDGEVLLTPLTSVPRRELIVWENEQLRDGLARGLEQSAAGQTVDLGSFAAYAIDDDDNESR